jgi:hypothetical protein
MESLAQWPFLAKFQIDGGCKEAGAKRGLFQDETSEKIPIRNPGPMQASLDRDP